MIGVYGTSDAASVGIISLGPTRKKIMIDQGNQGEWGYRQESGVIGDEVHSGSVIDGSSYRVCTSILRGLAEV